MKLLKGSVERISLATGLFTAAALIIYFFIMKLFGLERMLELRFLNFFILLGGAAYAIKKIIKIDGDYTNDDYYLKGFAAGILTSLVAVCIFSASISLYLAYLDTDLLSYIKATVSFGEMVTGFTVFLILFLEGMASSIIIVFCAMQYFKSKITTHAVSTTSPQH
jgi:hypothetical protein